MTRRNAREGGTATRKLLWLVALWAGGVLAVGALALLIRLVLGAA